MNKNEEKEYNPSEDEGFLRTINDVLDLQEEEPIEISTEASAIIDIPDVEKESKKDLSDTEWALYDDALMKNIDSFFEHATEENHSFEKIQSEILSSKEKDESEHTESVGQEKKPDLQEEETTKDEPLNARNDTTSKEILAINQEEKNQNEEAIIDDINSALALQLEEMNSEPPKKKKSKKWLLTFLPFVGIVLLCIKYRKIMPKWVMGIRIALFSIFAFFVLGTALSGGKLVYNLVGSYIRWRMPGEVVTPTPPISFSNEEGNVDTPSLPIEDPDEDSSLAQPDGKPARSEEHIVNILLLGEEKIGSEHSRGRTDLIMIATMDTKQRTVKLSSIMRDVLVAIPGHSDNRINAVYSMGGIDLLMEVIELNFEIVPDGYMLVDFDSFEKVVDKLDGVTIELSKKEANYLNTTNYISKPEYRNVSPGLNHLNGNQVLGYCRIRHVQTLDNNHSDFGRTSRQRTVLNAIFEKMKSKNILQLALIADSCLPLVTTNLTASQISDYMERMVNNRITSLVQFRVPIEGSFQDATYNGITDLLQINFPENNRALHEFIFGDYKAH